MLEVLLIAYLCHVWVGNLYSQDLLNGTLRELEIFRENLDLNFTDTVFPKNWEAF